MPQAPTAAEGVAAFADERNTVSSRTIALAAAASMVARSTLTVATIAIARLEKEMYQSGQRRTITYDSSPLTLNLDFLKPGYDFSKEETNTDYDFDFDSSDSTNYSSGSSTVSDDIDYNYLME